MNFLSVRNFSTRTLLTAAAVTLIFTSRMVLATDSPEMERSWNTPIVAEKIELRAALAKERPGTAEGLFAQAFLARQEGRIDESEKLYRECISGFPEFLYCSRNFLSSGFGAPEERQDLAKLMIAIDGAFDHYFPYVILYREYRKDPAKVVEAKLLLEEARTKYPGAPAATHLEIVGAFSDKNFPLASAQAESLIRDGERSRYIYSDYVAAAIRSLPKLAKKTMKEQTELLDPIYARINELPGMDIPAIRYVAATTRADELIKKNAHFLLVTNSYIDAYQALPSLDLVGPLFFRLVNHICGMPPVTVAAIKQILADAMDRFPDSYIVTYVEGRIAELLGKNEIARTRYENAVKRALIDKQRLQSEARLAILAAGVQSP